MRVAVLFLSILLAAKASVADDGATLKIGTEGLYPPWNATGDDGGLEGFEIDLAQDLCRRMEVTCELVKQRWDGMLPALTGGKFDIVMAGMAITEERQQFIEFSTCYAAEASVFATRADNALAGTLTPAERVDLSTFSPKAKSVINALRQALAGTTVGVQVASPHAAFVRRYLQDLVDIRYYDALENLTRDLDGGKIDAALSSRAYWQRLKQEDSGIDLALIGPDMMGDVFGEGVGAGIRKDDIRLRKKLNAAIEAALEDGTVSRLAKRWFGYDLSCS